MYNMQKKYKIITTEMWSSEYHIDAENEYDAINKILIGDWKDINIKSSTYNETIKDRDSMYVAEINN